MNDSLFTVMFEVRRSLRADFEDYRQAEYARAEEACRGAMLNARGRRADVDALDLFMGNESRAQAYASDELKEWWRNEGRPTFAWYLRWRGSGALTATA